MLSAVAVLTLSCFHPILCTVKTIVQLPHPDVIAARKALANKPQPPLERVLQQAKASEEWRRKHGSAAGLKKPGA